MFPVSLFSFFHKKIWIFSSFLKEISRLLFIQFISCRMIHTHKPDLNFLMSRDPCCFFRTKPADNMPCHIFHYIEQLFFSRCLIICHSCLHHMTCAIQFVTLKEILPAMLRLFDCKISIQIPVRLLCFCNDSNDFICPFFKLTIWL